MHQVKAHQMQCSSRVPGSRLPERFRDRLRLPIIAAPMLHVSGPDLVVAACRAGVIGAFPTMNPRVLQANGGLDGWLSEIRRQLAEDPGASGLICPNLIMRADDLDDHVDTILRHGVEMLGCDLAYMGTRFIAARESLATAEYREMLVRSSIDDIVLTKAFNGLWGSYLRPSIVAAGLDPDRLDDSVSADEAKQRYGSRSKGPRRWTGILSAGHSVSGVRAVQTVAEIVDQTKQEYEEA